MNRLINRNTGQIVVYGEGIVDLKSLGCKNVAEMLEAGWEDYKEPQVAYYIDRDGHIVSYQRKVACPKRVFDKEENEAIGNYFETREEAEKIVEKLKAWKRLKDKGFKFETFGYDRETVKNGRVNIMIRATFDEKYGDGSVKLSDLDLLFGGEE